MEKEKLLNELSSVCGISSEEYIDILKNMKQKNKDIKQLEKLTGYQKYDQRNYNNLNDYSP